MEEFQDDRRSCRASLVIHRERRRKTFRDNERLRAQQPLNSEMDETIADSDDADGATQQGSFVPWKSYGGEKTERKMEYEKTTNRRALRPHAVPSLLPPTPNSSTEPGHNGALPGFSSRGAHLPSFLQATPKWEANHSKPCFVNPVEQQPLVSPYDEGRHPTAARAVPVAADLPLEDRNIPIYGGGNVAEGLLQALSALVEEQGAVRVDWSMGGVPIRVCNTSTPSDNVTEVLNLLAAAIESDRTVS